MKRKILFGIGATMLMTTVAIASIHTRSLTLNVLTARSIPSYCVESDNVDCRSTESGNIYGNYVSNLPVQSRK